jgi:hypothetical protein
VEEAGINGEKRSSFGASTLFTLQSNRRPNSLTGWFTSTPHVDLIGSITAFAPDGDLLQGDGIAECKLFLKHTVFQYDFKLTGPERRILGQSQSEDPVIYLRNTGYADTSGLPGFKLFQTVGFSEAQLVGTLDLLTELEVRLDIYLKSAGAQVFCNPEVLLRTFQWPLVPA